MCARTRAAGSARSSRSSASTTTAEGQRVPHLQPERDPRRRCPAENGRRALLDRRQRPVERMLGLPGDGGGRADGVAAQPELLRGHDVRVVADRHHPPIGGVVEGVGGPGGREHRQHGGGGQRRHHQHLDRWPPPPPGRHQPAATPPAPASAATHNATVTSHAAGCRAIHHGGPRPARGTLTTALLGQAAETTIMISSEDPMQARATRPRRLPPARAVAPPPPGPVPAGQGASGPVPAGRAPAGSTPAAGGTRGTAVAAACSLMAHAPACPAAACTAAADGHDSITDGMDHRSEQPPGTAYGEGHPPGASS